MHLVAILVLYLEMSYTLCRSVRHKRHRSENTQQQTDSGDEPLRLKEFLGRELDGIFDTLVSTDPPSKGSQDDTSVKEANKRYQEISDILKSEKSETDYESKFKSEKESGKINEEESGKINEEESEEERHLNREKSYFLTENNEIDKSVERYMKNFYFDMISLFQYEIKEFAEKESQARQHRRKHRKHSFLRPKRSIRSLLRDAHIKDILMKYFQQKQNEENGKPLLRYG